MMAAKRSIMQCLNVCTLSKVVLGCLSGDDCQGELLLSVHLLRQQQELSSTFGKMRRALDNASGMPHCVMQVFSHPDGIWCTCP